MYSNLSVFFLRLLLVISLVASGIKFSPISRGPSPLRPWKIYPLRILNPTHGPSMHSTPLQNNNVSSLEATEFVWLGLKQCTYNSQSNSQLPFCVLGPNWKYKACVTLGLKAKVELKSSIPIGAITEISPKGFTLGVKAEKENKDTTLQPLTWSQGRKRIPYPKVSFVIK